MIAGQLEILMSANIARLADDMGKAQRTVGGAMKGIESSVASAKSALAALGLGLSVAAFASFVKGAIDAGDRMNDLRTRSGLLGQDLLILEGAAIRGGTSLEAISDVTSKLGKRLGAAEIGTGEAASAFKAMGINVNTASGELKSVDQIMRDVGEKFSTYKDGADKATLATAAFGKGGDKLIPVIQGIKETEERFKRLGITISEDFLTAADKFKDTMDDIRSLNDVLARQIATALLPHLQKVADIMVVLASNTESMKLKVDSVIIPLKVFATGFLTLHTAVALAGESIMGVELAMKSLFSGGGITGYMRELDAATERSNQRMRDHSKLVTAMWADPKAVAAGEVDNWDLMGRGFAPKLPGKAEKAGKAVDDGRGLIGKQWTEEQEEWNKIMSEAAHWTDEYNKRLREMSRFENMDIPGVTSEEDLKRYLEAIDALIESEERRMLIAGGFDEKGQAITKTLTKQNDIARELGMTFTSAFEKAVVGGEKFKDVLRSLAQDIATLFLRKQVTEPLAGMAVKFFAGLFTGAAGGGGGGEIAAANGADWMVGGSGGTDSQRVSFMATPRERVLVQTPEQQQASNGDTYYIDARGADSEGMARLRQQVAALNGSIEERAVSAVANSRTRGRTR